MLPKNAFHLLLGTPWQFDRDFIHQGRKNAYTFKKNGLTYKIQSLMEEESDEVAIAHNLLMSGKEFLNDIKHDEGVGFYIVLKPKEKMTLNRLLYLVK